MTTAPDRPGAIVVVSAHLDDGVLSAAAQLLRPGARLITVCAAEPGAGTPLGEWDLLTGATDAAQRVRDRVAEDDEAAAVLGVSDLVRLDFPDGQHLDGPRTDGSEMAAALTPYLADAAEIWLPAGIGRHPDHLATRDAGLEAARSVPHVPVRHFADVPYCLRPGWPASAPAEPDRQVHVLDDDAQRRKVMAMARYRTQLPWLDHSDALSTGDSAVVAFEVSWSRR